MAEYKLKVTTGDMKYAGTIDNVSVILFGAEGQSECVKLDNYGRDFTTGNVSCSVLKVVYHFQTG